MMHSDSLTWLEREAAEAPGAATLELMRPQDLPAEIALADAERETLRATLADLLAALDEANPARRAARVRALLGALGHGSGETAETGATAIPAGTAEVEDFDRYFRVRRVTGETPAHSLLRGLLQTAAAVTALAARGPDLPPALVAQQVAGFASYARLLGRVCGLGPLP